MSEILRLLIRPLGETILMIAASTLISTILGGGLGILLFTLSQDRFAGKYPGALLVKRIADRAINMFRSFPYVILMVLVLPLSRLIVGTSLGTIASIVPLSIAAIPFLARIVESSLASVYSCNSFSSAHCGIIALRSRFGSNRCSNFLCGLKDAHPICHSNS